MNSKTCKTTHKFDPSELLKLIDRAVANFDEWHKNAKVKMVGYLLENRAETIRYYAQPWHKRFSFFGWMFHVSLKDAIPSVERCHSLPYEEYDRLRAAVSHWRWNNDEFDFDGAIYGPKHDELTKLVNKAENLEEAFDDIRQLRNSIESMPIEYSYVPQETANLLKNWS